VNLDGLRPILAAYRAQVQQAWSAATAHEGYEGKAGDPAGQCGVTSAWLQRRLLEDHGIDAAFRGGHVLVTGVSTGADHCWLEIGEGSDRVVVDLTADQFSVLRPWPVVCSTHADLRDQGIDYVEQCWPTQLARRLAVLTEALT